MQLNEGIGRGSRLLYCTEQSDNHTVPVLWCVQTRIGEGFVQRRRGKKADPTVPNSNTPAPILFGTPLASSPREYPLVSSREYPVVLWLKVS